MSEENNNVINPETSMLSALEQEWNAACANATILEDRPCEQDAETIDMRKMSIVYRNTEVIIVSQRRPNSGTVAEAKVDETRGPKYLVTIYVPSTQKCVRNIPTTTICPRTEAMIKILEACGIENHQEVVQKRREAFEKERVDNRFDDLCNRIAGIPCDDKVKAAFVAWLEKNKDVKPSKLETFVRIVTNNWKDIACTDKELIANLDTQSQGNYHSRRTLLDSMYDTICNIFNSEVLDDYGNPVVRKQVIVHRFWDAEADVRMHPYMQHVRSTLRQIYSDCEERTALFIFILHGIALYFEIYTGEDVQMRIASMRERRTIDVKHDNWGRSVKFGPKFDRPREDNNLGSMSEFLPKNLFKN